MAGNGMLLVVETVRAPRNAPSPGKFLDSEMLLLFLHSYLNASS